VTSFAEPTVALRLRDWDKQPELTDPLYELARRCRLEGRYKVGHLFARRAARSPGHLAWQTAAEQAYCAYGTGRYGESLALWRSLLDYSALPEAERSRAEAGADACVPAILEQYIDYASSLVGSVMGELEWQRSGEDGDWPIGDVTLTIASSGRPDLFQRTMNSFLRCCEDRGRIARWLCVDTGLSENERISVRERYPFLELIELEASAAAGATALNVLAEAVATPYWLHLEDDWEFFWSGPYIARAIRILEAEPAAAQVAFNRNFAETLDDRRILGGATKSLDDGLRYRLHEYIEPGTPAWDEHFNGLPARGVTNAHWPHFTLGPSIMRTAAIRSLGPFDVSAAAFAEEFGHRFGAGALATAFFDSINCLRAGSHPALQPYADGVQFEQLQTLQAGDSFKSHVELWKEVAARGEDEMALVVGERARPIPGLSAALAVGLGEIASSYSLFDLALLGYDPVDETQWEGMPTMPVAHWYHVYAAGAWQEPLSEHLAALEHSGFDGSFHVGLVGSPQERAAVIRELSGIRPLDGVVEFTDGWEQVTLKAVREYARSHEGAVLYAHTKGAAFPRLWGTLWRRSMTRELVGQWRAAAHSLAGGFDAVGCHWLTSAYQSVTTPFFGGNYWMATTEYIRRLPPCPEQTRFDAERWVGIANPRVLDMLAGFPAYEGTTGCPGEVSPTDRVRPMRWLRFQAGDYGYVLSGRGARKLLELLDRDGAVAGFDQFLLHHGAELMTLEFSPPLVDRI
jgi:hypothetical protein